uniref:Macaca fascicularis brain cDNA, clone: QflA-16791 n=1 Tax=Macaca fascicularis TaxID=9541 RepID=I7GME1_MACFA|nr:unnamed protein product [Macaca fascicularis]
MLFPTSTWLKWPITSFIYFLRQGLSSPRLEYSGMIMVYCTSRAWVILPPQPCSWDHRHVPPCPASFL